MYIMNIKRSFYIHLSDETREELLSSYYPLVKLHLLHNKGLLKLHNFKDSCRTLLPSFEYYICRRQVFYIYSEQQLLPCDSWCCCLLCL
jgi:hypothetical protein